MGVMPIGFFSPLPLAIMIPFMATQSLAMGEAFGKSFQYGKRKISSMSNEEFNKYTFSDMMNEQTANVRAYIPKLHEQMELSYSLQIDIFQEMVKIIPAFFEALLKSLQPLSSQFENFNKTPFNQEIPIPGGTLVSASTPDSPTLISHSELTPEIEIISTKSYSQADFRALTTVRLEYKIANELKGSELSLAKHVLKTRRETEIAKQNQPEDVPSTPSAVEFTQWQHQLILIQQDWLATKARINSAVAKSQQFYIQTDRLKIHASKIRKISLDYRNPHNGIRNAVLVLRQEIANGHWTT